MDAVEEIKSRLNIEDVVGEYVQLKRAGRNWKGLSPFTSERSPSFMVSPEKGIWHDFSSGKGGNVFSFVMEMEGLEFKEALELLARKANIDLSQYRNGSSADSGKIKERLYKALELATRFYQTQMKNSEATLDYVFKKRQLTKETVLNFRIGYSPNNGDALLNFLKSKGFTEEEAQKAGLTARRYRGGLQDMFRGRLMIPLMDAQGRVIGFTARLLIDDPDAPKYINTPQTVLYDKGRHIFGLHLAKEALRREGFAVLVEGNMDVIASHQAGVLQTVATAGTALTEMHLKGISRFTGDIRLAFDQDKAGQAATERSIPIASKVGVSLSIISIPDGKDPDELVRKSPEVWREAINQNQYALDWLIKRYAKQLDLTTATGKKQFTDVLLKVVGQLNDEVEQDHYLSRIGEMIGIGKEALSGKLHGIEQSETRNLRRGKVQPVTDKHIFDLIKLQNSYLCLVMMRPKLRGNLGGLAAEMLPAAEAGVLLEFLQKNPDFDGSKAAQEAMLASVKSQEMMQKLQDYVRMLLLQYEALYQEIEDNDLDHEVSRLRARLIEQYVKTQKIELINAMAEAQDGDVSALLSKVKDLDQKLVELNRIDKETSK